MGKFKQPLEDVLTHLHHSKHDKSFYTLTEVEADAPSSSPPVTDGEYEYCRNSYTRSRSSTMPRATPNCLLTVPR